MTRWTNTEAKPDSTNTFKIPKDAKPVGFYGGSVIDRKSSCNSTVTSSTNGHAHTNGCDDYDDDEPVVNRGGTGKVYGKSTITESSSTVSSSDGWEHTKDRQAKATDFLKESASSSIGLANGAIALPCPPSLANGGNSSYFTNKQETVSRSPQSTSTNYSSAAWNSSFSRIPGDVGLTNLGNTCFLNSALQCLLHSGGLVEYFLTCKPMESLGSYNLPLIQSFQIVTQQVWSGQFESITLNDFRAVLGGIHPQFKDGRQHDCQEFLALTLDTLHEQLKKWTSEPIKSAEVIVNQELLCDETMDCENKEDMPQEKVQVKPALMNGHVVDIEEVSSSTSPTANLKLNAVAESCKKPLRNSNPGRKAYSSDSRQKSQLIPRNRKKTKSDRSSDDETTKKKIKVGEGVIEELKTEQESDIITNGNGHKPLSVDLPSNQCLEERPVESPKLSTGTSLKELKEKVDDYWNKHIAENNTVISSTFQGVYKSTVVCSQCSFVSITYEPFMYLSLPIPRITTKDLIVKSLNMKEPALDGINVTVTLDLTDSIAKLKEEVLKKVPPQNNMGDFAVAEVVNNYVSRQLDDNLSVRDINDGTRNIYFYELNDNFNEEFVNSCESGYAGFYPTPNSNPRNGLSISYTVEEDWDADTSHLLPVVEVHEGNSSDDRFSSTFVAETQEEKSSEEFTNHIDEAGNDSLTDMNESGRSEDPCCICLETGLKTSELRKHIGCGCVVCKDCLKRGAEHYSTTIDSDVNTKHSRIKCPQCMKVVEYEKEYAPFITNMDDLSHRMQLIVVLFRCDSDTNNNTSSSRIFGAPLIVKVPSYLATSRFNEFISQLNLYDNHEYKVMIVEREGTRCGSCIYTDDCHGCEITRFEEHGFINLASINTIAICYSNLSEEDISTFEPSDMMKGTSPSPLYSPTPWIIEPEVNIYDCLATFSESENLDEQNGWFCPKCNKHQCATKSMNVCKFPDYLIVYLKRFVFVNNSSIKLNNKLSFPLTELDLKPYISEESADNECMYDLYACVCHYGSASAGHYTAFGKNPVTQAWNYFNDSSVTPKTPGSLDYSSAYVLFYQKKGVTCKIPSSKSIKISTMLYPSRVACVVPYQSVSTCSPNSTTTKNYPGSQSSGGIRTYGTNDSEEVQLSITSSNSEPHTASCDSLKGLLIEEDEIDQNENQENHIPKKILNGHGSGDGHPPGLALGRKDRSLVHTNTNNLNAGDSVIGR